MSDDSTLQNGLIQPLPSMVKIFFLNSLKHLKKYRISMHIYFVLWTHVKLCYLHSNEFLNMRSYTSSVNFYRYDVSKNKFMFLKILCCLGRSLLLFWWILFDLICRWTLSLRLLSWIRMDAGQIYMGWAITKMAKSISLIFHSFMFVSVIFVYWEYSE